MTKLTHSQIANIQRGLNAFTSKYLHGVNPVMVDGEYGEATKRRVRSVKYYLGYSGTRNAVANVQFRQRLYHPKSLRYSTLVRLTRAASRRITQRKEAKAHDKKAAVTTGVTTFDGVPVAAWMTPYLAYARAHGWKGHLVSGWRDPQYSESLCIRMCGRPQCPGMCAGRISNHSGSVSPHGAVDVSDYIRFGEIIARYQHEPHLVNHLPADRVHYSASGN